MGKEKRHINVFFLGEMNDTMYNSLIRELGAISRSGPLKYLLEVAKKELRDQSLLWKFETSNYIFCVIDKAEKADCIVVMMTESTTSGSEANIEQHGFLNGGKQIICCCKMDEHSYNAVEGQLSSHFVKSGSEVKVNDDTFCSLEAHLQRKEAELDAAQVACTSLLSKCDDVTLRIEKDELCAKSILHEFALKSKSILPVYSSSIVKELEMTYWKSSVLFEGISYVSDDRAKNKRLSEQKAACAALKSILATEDHLLPSILVAKRKPTSAVAKSSRAAKKQKSSSE
ncbi:hypothetical protein VPH35_031738 [Triticum aestivum]